MAGCPALANTAYLGRHNQLAQLIHQELGFKYVLLDRKTTPPYYKYNPQPVVERGNVILYWDRPIVTDQTIDYNRPGILLINQDEKTATLVEIAVPLTHNLKKTEAEKMAKYEELAFQLKSILETGKRCHCTNNNFRRRSNLKENNIKHRELAVNKNILRMGQKAVLLQNCHLVRKFLN